MTTGKAAGAPAVPRLPADGGQPLIDLGGIVLAIRRKRRFWLTFAVLGLLAGAALAVMMPTPPSAVTRIYVVHEDDQPSDAGNLIRTDIAVIDTARIAQAALDEVGARQKATDFLKDYDAVGLTNNVLEVTVRAKTNDEAIRRAKALADVFIADHVGRVKASADAEAKALSDQRDKVQGELSKVNSQITGAETKARNAQNDGDGTGSDGATKTNAAQLDSLYARRAELTSRVSDLSQRAEEAGIGAPKVTAGTQVVDEPRAVRSSVLAKGATNAGIGLLLGLVIGWTLVAVAGVVKDKPVLRRDIAAHLGASVIGQLSSPRRGFARLLGRKRATRDRRRVAGTLVRLVRDGSGPVSVLELGSPRIAAALALDVATELATDRDVVIVEDPAGRVVSDDLPGRDLAELTGRADRPIRIIGADDTAPGLPGETRIGVGSVTPGTAWTDLTHLGGETLLVVRTGFADTAWLHTVARQLADNGIPIIGVVLVDPDPRDKSDGTLWDGLHTALRGRGRPVPEIAPAEQAVTEPAPAPALVPVPVATPAPALVEHQEPVAAPTPAPTPEPVAKPKPYPARKPEWAPEPVVKATPAAPAEQSAVSTQDAAEAEAVAETEREEAAPEPRPAEPVAAQQRKPVPAPVYPAPVPANGVNGARDNADLPTRRFAPVQPHLMNDGGASDEENIHDLPTKRFAPVRQDVEELAHRRNNG
jgi:capsular polysaccharide biosynthesis protein